MEMLGNLGIFIIGTAVITVIWLGYMTLNNVVDKIISPQVRELAGGLSTILLFIAIGFVFYLTDVEYFMGLIIATAIWFVFSMGKKMLASSEAKKA